MKHDTVKPISSVQMAESSSFVGPKINFCRVQLVNVITANKVKAILNCTETRHKNSAEINRLRRKMCAVAVSCDEQ